MPIRSLTTMCLGAALLVAAPTRAQVSSPPAALAPRTGQTVYIAAFHRLEPAPSAKANGGIRTSLIDSHLPAELRIRQEFEKRRIYTPVEKASAADFVFLVLIDDSAAEGLALAPGVFAQYQKEIGGSIEALREAASTRSTVGPLKLHNLSRISEMLVRRFHEQRGAGSFAQGVRAGA